MSDSQAEPEEAPETAVAPATPAPPPGRALAWAGRHGTLLLALFCLALWLPGIVSLPALDRDESRFAQSSRQMLETGNFVDIRLGHVPRYKKPVGIYWLQAATTAAAAPFAGLGHIWTYRLASLLGALLAVWLTAWCARAVAGPEAAFLSGALMAGTLLLTAEATIATTDAVVLACVLGVQGVLLRVWRAAREPDAARVSPRLVLAGWAALAAGILVKFPVVPGVALATIAGLIAWDRQWRWLGGLKPVRGLLLTGLLVLPWLVAIAMASKGAFFQQSLGDDFAAKLVNGQESHGAPPGYFLALAGLSFWPAILFVAPGIALGIARRGEPAVRFLLVWAAGWWLLVEAVPTKLPHYVLPAYPALAILAALWITGSREALSGKQMGRWEKIARWTGGGLFVLGGGALTTALVLAPHYFGDDGIARLLPWLWGAAALGATLALTSLSLFACDMRGSALALALAATLVLVPALSAGAGPRMSRLWLTTRLAAQAIADARPGDPPPVLAGYDEPSMLFALGADTALSDGAGAADLTAARGGLALVEARERDAFLARLAEKEADATALETVTGFNYSRGREALVTIYRVAPPQ